MPEDNDVERLLAGECCHGKGRDCLECAMTRYLVVQMRSILQGMFPRR